MSPLIAEITSDSAPTTIHLTEVESTLRRLLLDVANWIDNTPDAASSTTLSIPPELAKEKLILRFTGGWVRDKLLGIPSHDIDVALNKMSGYAFGLLLQTYLNFPGNAEKYGISGETQKKALGLHKIAANPDKSKHLETVTTKLFGLDLDFVNLRKETYTAESRTPEIEFGTPEEDALRRDATVNALFYNIHAQEVEDFTGRGLEDLAAKVLRTPLPAYETFEDDPLRVLRLIRFSSRLGYTIDREALAAMGEAGIKAALKKKISRERIGVEMEKALRGPGPYEALRLIAVAGLYSTVFCDAAAEAHYPPDTKGWENTITFLRDYIQAGSDLSEILIQDAEDSFLAWQLAALVPYRDAPVLEAEAGRRAPPPLAACVAREGVKATNKVCDVVALAVKHQHEISGLLDKVYQQKRRPAKQEEEDVTARDVLGMAIRKWGNSWRSQVVYSMLVEVADQHEGSEAIEKKYATFMQCIVDLRLLDVCTFKPLMDGKTLAKALDVPPGPWMKDALDVVMAFQLRYPEAKAEDAIKEVAATREREENGSAKVNGHGGELTSSLLQHFLLILRPYFKGNATITDAGRKNEKTVLPKKINVNEEDKRPWRGGEKNTVLPLLQWCATALDQTRIEKFWPGIAPPVLTLLDDWETEYKSLGAKLLREVLQATPSALLKKTGLGEVFEDALMPCLTYLPPVTEEKECIALLGEVYLALLVLSRVRYTNATDPERIKFLDSTMRKGFLYAYTHLSATANLDLLRLEFEHLSPLLKEMGIESVKHLKFLLPVISETLMQSLLMESNEGREVLLAATRALQALILNAWPRIVGYRGEVLKGLCFCWINLGDREDHELRKELKVVVTILQVAIKEEVNWQQEVGLLVEEDSRVKELLEA